MSTVYCNNPHVVISILKELQTPSAEENSEVKALEKAIKDFFVKLLFFKSRTFTLNAAYDMANSF